MGKRQRLSGETLEREHLVRDVDGSGLGIVEVEGHRVLIPGAWLGETIHLQLTHRGKHGIHRARLRQLSTLSPERVDSPCPHFLDCGGCDLLHVRPEAQYTWKRQRLATELVRPLETIEPVRYSEHHYDYRAYAKFVVGPKGELGSYRRASHSVAKMDHCVVHAPAIAAAHAFVQDKLRELRPAGLRYVVMRASLADERVIVTLICTSPRAGLYRALAHDLGREPFIAAVDFHYNDSEGNAVFGSEAIERLYDDGKELQESIGVLQLRLKSHAFSQINPAAAALLYEHVSQELSALGKDSSSVLDLYAGSGGIGLSHLLRQPDSSVKAVEAVEAANVAARMTAQTHGLGDRHEAIDSDVLSFLRGETTVSEPVVVNPPRRGLGSDVIGELVRLAPTAIIYVSCNPKTLARDCKALESSGYEIRRVTPFDMFPNTAQIETAITLVRREDID